MKKYFILFALILFAVAGMAQETVNLGYCAGEINTKGTVTTEGKKWVSGAIFLPAEMLSPYAGGNIKAIRAGLSSKINVDSLVVWVRNDLESNNISADTITLKTSQVIVKGWNEVTLKNTVRINAANGLYIGYSYRQKAKTGAMSVIGSSVDNAFFAQLGDDAEWQDMSSSGILSVEAVVEGNKPGYDLGLLSATADPYRDAAYNVITATVSNNGSNAVAGFTIETKYENSNDIYTTHIDLPTAPGEKVEFTFNIPAQDMSVAGNVRMSIKELDDAVDEVASNNTITAKVVMVKKVFIEEFTTEKCGNCPRVAGYLKNVLNMDKYKNRAVAVCHHSGYYTDWLTLPCDAEYLWLFGGGQYAPAMGFDRYPLFYSGGKYNILTCPDQETIEQSIDARLNEQANTSILISLSFDESTQTLGVNINGTRKRQAVNDMYLTVYLVENNIMPKLQSGMEPGFMHQHVVRQYNSTWGDLIVWEGDKFNNHYDFTIDSSWKPADMQIVAVVGAYDKDNYLNCVSDNVECVNIGSLISTEIKSVNTDNGKAEEYYDISGRKLNAKQKGINIVKTSNGSVKKIFVK